VVSDVKDEEGCTKDEEEGVDKAVGEVGEREVGEVGEVGETGSPPEKIL